MKNTIIVVVNAIELDGPESQLEIRETIFKKITNVKHGKNLKVLLQILGVNR